MQRHLQGKLLQRSFGAKHPSPVHLRITHAVLVTPVTVALEPSAVVDPPLLENYLRHIWPSIAMQIVMRTWEQ